MNVGCRNMLLRWSYDNTSLHVDNVDPAFSSLTVRTDAAVADAAGVDHSHLLVLVGPGLPSEAKEVAVVPRIQRPGVA